MKEEAAIKAIHFSKLTAWLLRSEFRRAGSEISYEQWMVLAHAGMMPDLS